MLPSGSYTWFQIVGVIVGEPRVQGGGKEQCFGSQPTARAAPGT
jgi:hypothetical protein